MATLTLSPTQLSLAPVLPGNWKLPARQAITLQPREAGVLRVVSGRIWATGDGPHRGPLNDLGDRVVGVGSELRLGAGERLVIEALDARVPAYFSWEPAPRRAGAVMRRFEPLVQPWSDLRLALGFAAAAAARLARGLAGLAVARTERRAACGGAAV